MIVRHLVVGKHKHGKHQTPLLVVFRFKNKVDAFTKTYLKHDTNAKNFILFYESYATSSRHF